MKNILIINRKGGVGKTLVADELAFALDAKNVPYCFYDLDGQGGTLHEPVEMDNADVSIIDTPGSLQGEMGEWVKDADVVIIPMRPSVTDMPATETTIDLVKRNAPDTPIVYVVNGTNRFKATKEFMEFFKEEHKDEPIYCLPQSEAFVQSRLANQSVIAYNPRLLASLATSVLTHGVWKILKLKF